jgi:hypothetical protein
VAARGTTGKFFAGALLASSVAVVGWARPRAVASTRAVTAASDVFALPPPAMLNALSLGYRSALADLLFTSTRISYGTHHEEHRRFEFIAQYLESIVALDPQFCQTYHYVDTFITYQPIGMPSPEDVRRARRLLERGLEMCPSDGQLWLSAAQYVAFIAIQFLPSDKEKNEFRIAGAKMFARAAEVTGDNANAQWHSLAAAGIFTREGDRESAMAFYERIYAITENEEIKAEIASKLAGLESERRIERNRRRDDAFNRVWHDDLPFLSRVGVLVVGPRYDQARCAGEGPGIRGCARSWADWPFDDAP